MNFFKKLFHCSKKSEEVENIANESENDTVKELDDESLEHVSAAGEIDVSNNKQHVTSKIVIRGKGSVK